MQYQQPPRQHLYQPQRSFPQTNTNVIPQHSGRPVSLQMSNNRRPEVPRQPNMYSQDERPSPIRSPVQHQPTSNNWHHNNNRDIQSPTKTVPNSQPYNNNNSYKQMKSPPRTSSPLTSPGYQNPRPGFNPNSSQITTSPARVTSSPMRATSSPVRALARAVSVPTRSQSPQAFSYIREPRQLNASEITPSPQFSSPYVKPKYDTTPKDEDVKPFVDPYDSSQYVVTTEHGKIYLWK